MCACVCLSVCNKPSTCNIKYYIAFSCVQRLSDANFGERKKLNSRKRTLLESLVN